MRAIMLGVDAISRKRKVPAGSDPCRPVDRHRELATRGAPTIRSENIGLAVPISFETMGISQCEGCKAPPDHNSDQAFHAATIGPRPTRFAAAYPSTFSRGRCERTLPRVG